MFPRRDVSRWADARRLVPGLLILLALFLAGEAIARAARLPIPEATSRC